MIRLTVLSVVPQSAAAARKLPSSRKAARMSMRCLGDFNLTSSGPVVVRVDSDTIADRGTSRVQIREAREVRTFGGHQRGLSHGHGHVDSFLFLACE